MEFVARPGEPSEPHALEAMMNLQVGKAHLDTLALVARFEKGFVRISRRATSRASSWVSRGTCRAGMLGQHFTLSAQASQSNFEAR